MIYLVGGASRAGKSIFAHTLRQATGGTAIAGDAFRSMLRSTIDASAAPALHWRQNHGLDDPAAYIDYFVGHSPQAIENMRQEASEIWAFYREYIKAFARESDDDLIIESVDILPEFVGEIDAPVQAYFFIDTSEQQAERILEHLEKERHGWLQSKRLTRDQIKQWAIFNARRSEYIKKQAGLYHQAYFDVVKIGYNETQERAYSLWLTKTRS